MRDLEQAQRGEDPVAGGGILAKNHVAGLLSAQGRAQPHHFFQHVLVAHRRACHANAVALRALAHAVSPPLVLNLTGPAPAEGLHPGQLAPEFSVKNADGSTLTLKDLNGQPISLAALRGHAVWVNFWTSWCPPCQVETPVLREIDAAYRSKGLVIVGISVQESNTQDVATYAAKYGLTYPIGADLTGAIFRLYRANALPTHVFIRPDGVIRDVVVNPLDITEATAEVEAILDPDSPPASPSASP